MDAVRRVGLTTVVGTCDAANSTTLPVVNLLMFPVKMFPVKVVGGVKLVPWTVISVGADVEFAPGLAAEFTSAEAGLTVDTLGVVNPMVKSLLRLLLPVITMVLPPGETV